MTSIVKISLVLVGLALGLAVAALSVVKQIRAYL